MARSAAASLALGASTVAGVLAAVASLLPPALRGGPRGRRVAVFRRPHDVPAQGHTSPAAERALPQ